MFMEEDTSMKPTTQKVSEQNTNNADQYDQYDHCCDGDCDCWSDDDEYYYDENDQYYEEEPRRGDYCHEEECC